MGREGKENERKKGECGRREEAWRGERREGEGRGKSPAWLSQDLGSTPISLTLVLSFPVLS